MTTTPLRIITSVKLGCGFRNLMAFNSTGFQSFLVVCAIIGVLVFLPVSSLAFALPSTSDMPESIRVRGKAIALKHLKNPLRQDQTSLTKNIRAGGEVYFKKCFLCHGDHLNGKGLFGNRFFPPPADFTHPTSVVALPESYAYWRIMKGGQGLPEKFAPWSSAMPAWENQLTEDEVWKVILYIYANAAEKKNPVTQAVEPEPSLERGQELHHEKCSFCHGDAGKGDGLSAKYSSPQPRNFTKSHIKIRSTAFGKIPTDQDIFDRITLGMPGTTMPGWSHLSESDRWSLVLYLKSLGRKYKRFVDKGKTHKPIVVPDPPPFTLESLVAGKELFLQNCSGCHGVKGRSDGASTHKIVDLESNAIWPRNLSKPWAFRRGNSRKQLFMTLRTGLSTTSMPRFSPRIFNDQQIWDIVNYVQTLSPPKKPPVKKVIHVASMTGAVPSTPTDPQWKGVEAYFIPLGGQILNAEKSFFPIVDNIIVKAVHNDDEISFYIHWDDPSYDPILAKTATVEESPPPPLPPEFQVEKSEIEEPEEEPQAQEFPDALAVQFPATPDENGRKPYFLNGDSSHPVNLWKWQSHPNGVLEMNATGLKHWTTQPKENHVVLSYSGYRYGRYFLVMSRKLKTDDVKNDVQFEKTVKIPIAFNVWDGSQGEEGTKKAISSWFDLVLE